VEASIRTGRKNSLREYFVPDIRAAYHISFMHLREVNRDWFYPSHEHKQYEINYVLSGRQIMRLNGQEYDQRAGDCVLIRPGDVHASTVGDAGNLTYFCLHFETDDRPFLHLLRTTSVSLIGAATPEGAALGRELRRLAEWVGSGSRFSLADRAYAQSMFFRVVGLLCEALAVRQSERDEPPVRHSELAHRIAALIQAAAKKPIYHGHRDDGRLRIRDVARELGISESHCNRLFKKVYGVSPRKFWSGLIVEEARQLLLHSSLTVERIAGLLGYSDIAHFSRQFKRWTGEAPDAFRRGSGGRPADVDGGFA
jgi:AraC-like DNA-binding protein/mannose-6-phosphate isomerase-like protein (cupin superfamily)